jgi:hypothetical protein
VSLGQGWWAVPDVNAFAEGIDRAVQMAESGDGEVVVLSAMDRLRRWHRTIKTRDLFGAPSAAEA